MFKMFNRKKPLELKSTELRLITDLLWEAAYKLENTIVGTLTIKETTLLQDRTKEIYLLRDKLQKEVPTI